MSSEHTERKDPTSFLPEEPMVYEFKKKKKKKRKHKQEDPFKDIADISKLPVEITTELDPEVTEELEPEVTIKVENIEVELDFHDYDNDMGPLLQELPDQEPAVPIPEEDSSKDAVLLTFENVIGNTPILNIKKETKPTDLHRCPTCHLVFKTLRTLSLHQRKKHKAYKKNFIYACNSCSLTYDKKNSLQAHMKRKHSPDSVPDDCEDRVCDICALVFKGWHRLRMHKQRKHGAYAEDFKYQCLDCGLTYDKYSSLKAHTSRKHSRIRKRKRIELLECPLCPSVLRNRDTYIRHVQRKHNSETKIPEEFLENLKEVNKSGEIPCKQCPLVFSSMTYLRLHMRRKHNACDENFKLKCSICNLSYDKIESLKKHIQRKHGEGTYCSSCNKDFASRDAFLNHSHKRPIIECNICGLIFATRGGLKKHMRCTHKVESGTKKFTCYVCKEGFYETRQLRDHLRSVHLKITYPCKFCKKSFKNKESYRRHCERTHSGQYAKDSSEYYKCSVCPLDDFLTETDLCRHIYTAHSRPTNDIKIENGPTIKIEETTELSEQEINKDDTRTYQCTKCEVTSKTWEELRKHYEQTHHVVKETQCQACGQFLKETDLPKHMKLVHPVEVEMKCPYCEYVTTSKASLMQHTLRHKNATTITCEYQGCKYKTYFQAKMDKHKKNHMELGTKLQCSQCPFQSMNKYILRYHEEAHTTGKKKYACDQCDYATILPANLVQHKYKHSLVKRFKCEYCPFASKYNTSLRFHVKTKHGDLPFLGVKRQS